MLHRKRSSAPSLTFPALAINVDQQEIAEVSLKCRWLKEGSDLCALTQTPYLTNFEDYHR